jgi:hypothetical protein
MVAMADSHDTLPDQATLDDQMALDLCTSLFHPSGLCCPRCSGRDYNIHRRRRPHTPDYKCKDCGKVFNYWSNTVFCGTHFRPSEVFFLLVGLAACKNKSTSLGLRDLAIGINCNIEAVRRLHNRIQSFSSAYDSWLLHLRKTCIKEANELAQRVGSREQCSGDRFEGVILYIREHQRFHSGRTPIEPDEYISESVGLREAITLAQEHEDKECC